MKIVGSLLYILDSDAGVVHKFSADGGYINFIGGFRGAIKIHVTQSAIWTLYADRVVQVSLQGDIVQSYSLLKTVRAADIFCASKLTLCSYR